MIVFCQLYLRSHLAAWEWIWYWSQRQQEVQVQQRLHSAYGFKVQPWTVLFWLLLCFSSGCIARNYRYGLDRQGSAEPVLATSDSLTVSYGEPPPRLVRLEKFVQWPRDSIRKLSGQPALEPEVELARRAEAVSLVEEYLLANGVGELFIDVRIYDPWAQWERLTANQSLHPIFRYTGGSLAWLRYTLLPRTVFRSDHFDPFTNTLSLNSDDPARAIFESARAKEFHRERLVGRGAYAALQWVPLVPLIHETRSASDALTYSEHHLEGRLRDELYPLAYARVGSTAVSEALTVFSLSPGTPAFTRPLLVGSGKLTGRSIGRLMSQEHQPSDTAETKD
jgi:hypothetical protein